LQLVEAHVHTNARANGEKRVEEAGGLSGLVELGAVELARRLVATQAAMHKQTSYTRALQGMSQAQAKEVEALTAKADRLSLQLREHKKKVKEAERSTKSQAILSQVFCLEQQLHAEKAKVAHLTTTVTALLAHHPSQSDPNPPPLCLDAQ
jgi:predicted RNase H-like nuclease (RuvC/YqgF family)